jgi:predicted transcriptional regulator
MDLDELWNHTEPNAGIERDYFDQYFSGRESGYAVEVQHARRYPQPLELLQHFGIEHPPQSFRYIR